MVADVKFLGSTVSITGGIIKIKIIRHEHFVIHSKLDHRTAGKVRKVEEKGHSDIEIIICG